MESLQKDADEDIKPVVSKPKRRRIRFPGTCKVCGKAFKDKSQIYAHMRIHTGERPFVCHLCQKSFNQSSHLKRHIKISHLGERRFHCETCNKRFSTKQYLEEHIRSHTGERPFACRFCDKRFAARSIFLYHEQCHMRKGSVACDKCHYRCDSQRQLKRHLRVHDADRRSYVCEICRDVYARKDRLDKHLKNKHNIDVAFECKICHKYFYSRLQLKKHYPVHELSENDNSTINEEEGSRVVVKQEVTDSSDEYATFKSAEEDGDTYVEQNNSSNDSENESKSYVLEKIKEEPGIHHEEIACQKLSRLEQISDHDSARNRFLCGVCREEFRDVTEIKAHLSIHTDDEKPFVCGICTERFWTRIKLKTHMKSNHSPGKVLLKCFICKTTFNDKDEFKKHILLHTTEKKLSLGLF